MMLIKCVGIDLKIGVWCKTGKKIGAARISSGMINGLGGCGLRGWIC